MEFVYGVFVRISVENELKCKNLIVITWDYEAVEEIKSKKIKFVPLWKWLAVKKSTETFKYYLDI